MQQPAASSEGSLQYPDDSEAGPPDVDDNPPHPRGPPDVERRNEDSELHSHSQIDEGSEDASRRASPSFPSPTPKNESPVLKSNERNPPLPAMPSSLEGPRDDARKMDQLPSGRNKK